MKKSDLVRSYLDRYPTMPSRTLAKLISAENGGDSELIRNTIRYFRKARGVESRKKVTTDKYVTDYSLPEPDNNDFRPFVLNANRLLVLSDIHIPYHDNQAVTAALRWAERHNPDAILLNGDILDCYQLSVFMRDSRRKNMAFELDALRWFLEQLNETFPEAKIYYKLGNHEERIEYYLIRQAPELLGLIDYTMDKLLPADDYNLQVIGQKRIIHFGKVNILHGHEILKGAAVPVNPARSTYLKTTESTIVGHLHKTSEHTEVTLNGDMITAWSTGCLCHLHPQYAPINKWNHGFAFVRIENDLFKVSNLRISDGRIL